MFVCVDTNVMLSALAKGSPLAPIFDAITAGKLGLAVSTSILFSMKKSPSNKVVLSLLKSSCE